ncbi:MAG: hypothetical protein ACM336_05515 [Acidobacteriota bacterium]
MKSLTLFSLALALAGTGFAQQWDVGGIGGFGFYKNVTVSGPDGSADAGFKNGAAAGAFATQHLYEHLSGQFRYLYQFDKLKVSSGGAEATFGGESHAVHYDLMYMVTGRDAAVRPYLVGGGGVKLYRGTGEQHAVQELIEFAALTHTSQVKPLVTFGGGVRAKLGAHAALYIEGRDYLTPFPEKVVAPVPPSKLSGWLHDFVPLVGLSFSF